MNTLVKICSVIFILTNGLSLANDQTKYTEEIEYLASNANKLMGFNGTVLIANSDEILFQKSYGFSDKEKKTVLIPEHRLSPGSIAKEFTTVAVMMLKEKGLLSYEDKLSKYLPELPQWSSTVSIQNIMTHTSGLPKIKFKINIASADVLEQISAVEKLEFEPGKGYLYGNMNVFLRTLIVEQITGDSFENYLHSSILKPAGMTSTYHRTNANAETQPKMTSGVFPTAISGLTIYTTASDLYQWEKALWNNTLVNIDALKKVILEKGLSGNNLRAFFDFGNFKLNEKGELTDVMHDGSHPSHHAYKSINFTKDLIIILMSSDGRKSTLYELHEGLSNISHNSPVILPASWWLSHQIKTEGIDVALEAYKSKLTIDNDLNSNEQTLNNLGYGLYANKQLEEALKVMKLNLELYPNSANTYDSYAELLIDANKQAEALPFIKQGIKVATKNKNGQLLTILKSKLIKYNDEVNK